MTDVISLDSIDIGKALKVFSVGSEFQMVQRLKDIGVVENTVITCLMSSPLGDPRAYGIRGAVIALRREDARQILGYAVEYCSGDDHDGQTL